MAMYKSSPSGLVDVNSTRQSKGTVYFSHAMSMQSSQPPSALQYAAAEPTGARSVMSTQASADRSRRLSRRDGDRDSGRGTVDELAQRRKR